MPPTDKPMPELLTKRELQGLRDNWHRIAYGDAALNTIEAFAELLAWAGEQLDGYCDEPKCRRAEEGGGSMNGEWQPIETAPKIEDDVDRWVILNTSRGVTCGYWGPQYFGMDYTWVQFHHRSECITIEGEVTHWMPLPPAPAYQPRKIIR